MNRVYIGIDPGVNGGLVSIYPDNRIDFTEMSSTEQEVFNWTRARSKYFNLAKPDSITHAVIEKVSGYIGDGGDDQKGGGAANGASMFTFGESYGGLRMALVASGLVEGESFWAVRPQVWQKALGIKPRVKRPKKETDTQWKNRLKSEAQERFPQLKVTLHTADALLIAYYCRMIHQ